MGESDVAGRSEGTGGELGVRPDFQARMDHHSSLREHLLQLPVEYNGHFRCGADAATWTGVPLLSYAYFAHLLYFSEEVAADWLSPGGRRRGQFLPVGALVGCSCPHCGRYSFQLESDGCEVRFLGEPCPHPGGLPRTQWELNVPSGQLVVTNDLRGLFPLPPGQGEESVNSLYGCRLYTLAYAGVGLAIACVGNSSPGVYRVSNGTDRPSYMVADRRGDPPAGWEEVAGVCTDLWWYSCCDGDELRRRLDRFGLEDTSFQEVSVAPGLYRFRHHLGTVWNDRSGSTASTFTEVERVRDADPPVDYWEQHQRVNICAYQWVRHWVQQYPILFGVRYKGWSDLTEEERVRSWQHVAARLFFLDDDSKWGERGFPLAHVDESLPDLEPPQLRGRHYWWLNGISLKNLKRTPPLHKTAPSFVKLWFRCLESIISFGALETRRAGSGDLEVFQLEAVQQYRASAARFPALADPEYVRWLSEPDRAERWVRDFHSR